MWHPAGQEQPDFIHKLKIAGEEADDTIFRSEIPDESGMFHSQDLQPLKTEVNELVSIIVAGIKTAKKSTPPGSQTAKGKPEIVNPLFLHFPDRIQHGPVHPFHHGHHFVCELRHGRYAADLFSFGLEFFNGFDRK